MSCVRPSPAGTKAAYLPHTGDSRIVNRGLYLDIQSSPGESAPPAEIIFAGNSYQFDSHREEQNLLAFRKHLRPIMGNTSANGSSSGLFVVLGGMGETKEQIMASYRTLLGRQTWIVYGIPGYSEDLAAHRSAMKELAKEYTLIDGSLAPLLRFHQVQIIAVGGAANPDRILAGNNGCIFHQNDLHDLFKIAQLETVTKHVVASNVPPRQFDGGANSSDRSRTGFHLGSRPLADAIKNFRGATLIHAQIPESAPSPTATGKILSAGAITNVNHREMDPVIAFHLKSTVKHGSQVRIERSLKK